MRSITIYILCMFTLHAFGQSTPTYHVWSVQQCIDYAKENNINVRKALLQIQATIEQNKSYTAGALPNISAGVSTTYNPVITATAFPDFISPTVFNLLQSLGVKDGSGNPIVPPKSYNNITAAFGTTWQANASAQLKQILFDGQVFIGLQARTANLQVAKQTEKLTEQNIRVNIYKIYEQLLIGEKQITLLDNNIAQSNDILHDVEVLVKNGLAEKLDINRIQVQKTNIVTLRNKATNDIQSGFLALKFLIGMPLSDTLILSDNISATTINDLAIQDTAIAYEDNLSFQSAKANYDLNKYSVDRYRYSKIPSIVLNASGGTIAYRNAFNFFNKDSWYPFANVSLNINLPIYNGGNTKALIRMSELQVKSLRADVENMKQQIAQQSITALLNFKTAINNLQQQEENMQLSESIYIESKKKYEQGLGSSSDIRNAQIDLNTSQSNYLQALYSAIMARIDYLQINGKI